MPVEYDENTRQKVNDQFKAIKVNNKVTEMQKVAKFLREIHVNILRQY